MLLMLALMFLITSLDGQPSQNDVWRDQQPFLYIYEDLSANLKDTWPPANMSGKSVNNSIFRQSMRENRGYGTLIDPSCGMYNTWQVVRCHEDSKIAFLRDFQDSSSPLFIFHLAFMFTLEKLISLCTSNFFLFLCMCIVVQRF